MISLLPPRFGVHPGPPIRDIYGNDTPGPDEEHPLPGCAIAPGPGGEIVGGRDTITEHLAICAPANADVRPTDRLQVRGLTYSVHGPVEAYRSPLTGTTAGVRITARRVTGWLS